MKEYPNKICVTSNICYICEKKLPPFLVTPVLQLPDGSLENCCEECADKKFSGWREEDQEKV